MKKSLKLVGIFMAVMLIVIVGGLSGYFLIQSNKTYYINDLRLVEPIADQSSYMYTDTKLEYKSIKNKTVFMSSEEENCFEIGIYVNATDKANRFRIISSDTKVANYVVRNNKCYIHYYMAGVATITVSLDGVEDSFELRVYDQVAEDLAVYDYTYYGDYAKYFPNRVVSYADSTMYEYDYVINSVYGHQDNSVDSDLIRVITPEDEWSKDFDHVGINAETQMLEVTCKPRTSTVDKTIALQSFYYSEQGELKVTNNYTVNVHIVAYQPQFLQLVLGTTQDFEDGYVFADTTLVDTEDLTEENILEDKTILDEFLSYQKSEMYLASNKEKAVYDVVFTEKVSNIFIKLRKVYTNGDIVYLNPTDTDNPYTLTTTNSDYFKLSQNKESYELKIDPSYFEDKTKTFDVYLKLENLVNMSLDNTFVFRFAELSAENLNLFYDYDFETKQFTYTYWDPRTYYDNERCDEAGNIIGFAGLSVDLSVFGEPPAIPDAPEGEGGDA